MSDQSAAPEYSDQPTDETENTEAPGAAGSAQNGEASPESSFSQFDLTEVPEDARQYVEQYSKRLQGDYTRKMQEMSEQRKQYEEFEPIRDWYESLSTDPEVMAATYAQLQEMLDQSGYWNDDTDTQDEVEYDGEEGFHDPRLDPILEQIEAAQQQQEYDNYVNAVAEQMANDLTEATKGLGYELNEDELTFVTNFAMTMADDNGIPDMRGAVDKLRSIQAAELSRVIDSKHTPRVDTGVPGSENLDLNDPDIRRQQIADIAESMQARDNT